MTTMVSKFGSEKGTILGVFRSLGALARALGPVFGSIGKYSLFVLGENLKKETFQLFGLLDQGSPTFWVAFF